MNPVIAECKSRHGDGPCITAYAADLETVTSTFDCVGWCPLLERRIIDEDENDERDSR